MSWIKYKYISQLKLITKLEIKLNEKKENKNVNLTRIDVSYNMHAKYK